ncbi:unnamed protein product [Dibothriocephalus latus]|uniref:ABC-2 type transporter domain-containing protein n=1 Tax=Dibothriocephalus latus TaxID=60516 RepID=A0A3P6PPG9_DIBLA|nr:unnamed protein product [Dibothriocephalus latus]
MLSVWALLLFTFPYVGAIPTVGKGLYALWVCILFLSLSGVFVLMPAATCRIFGSTYMAVNYGMIFSAFVSNLLTSVPFPNYAIFCPSMHEASETVSVLLHACLQTASKSVLKVRGISSDFKICNPTVCPPQTVKPPLDFDL